MQFKKVILTAMLIVGSVLAITSCSTSSSVKKAGISGKIEKGDVIAATCTLQGIDNKGTLQGTPTTITFNAKNSTYSASTVPEDTAVEVSCKVTKYINEITGKDVTPKDGKDFTLTTVSKADASTANMNVLTTLASKDTIAGITSDADIAELMKTNIGNAYRSITGKTLPTEYNPATSNLNDKALRQATIAVLYKVNDATDKSSLADIFGGKVKVDELAPAFTAAAKLATYEKFQDEGHSTGLDVDNNSDNGTETKIVKNDHSNGSNGSPSIKFAKSTIGGSTPITISSSDTVMATGVPASAAQFTLIANDVTFDSASAMYAITSDKADAKPVIIEVGSPESITALFKADDVPTTFTVCMLSEDAKTDGSDCKANASLDTNVVAIAIFKAKTTTPTPPTGTGTTPPTGTGTITPPPTGTGTITPPPTAIGLDVSLGAITGTLPASTWSDVGGAIPNLVLPVGSTADTPVTFDIAASGETTKKVVISNGIDTDDAHIIVATVSGTTPYKATIGATYRDKIKALLADVDKKPVQLFINLLDTTRIPATDYKKATAADKILTVSVAASLGDITGNPILGTQWIDTTTKTPKAVLSRQGGKDTSVKFKIAVTGTTTNKKVVISNGIDTDIAVAVKSGEATVDTATHDIALNMSKLLAHVKTSGAKLYICVLDATDAADPTNCKATTPGVKTLTVTAH